MLQSVRGTVLMMPPVEKFEKMVAAVGLLRCYSAISCCEYLHMLEVAIGNFSLVYTAASLDKMEIMYIKIKRGLDTMALAST